MAFNFPGTGGIGGALVSGRRPGSFNDLLGMGEPPGPPDGMMTNPAYQDWLTRYGGYRPTNLRGGGGQDMTNEMNRHYNNWMPPAPQQWIFDPDWERQMEEVKSPQENPGGGGGGPVQFAPPPGGRGSLPQWKAPVAPPNIGGGNAPPLIAPPPGGRAGLFHQPPNAAIQQVAQALLGRR